MNTSRPLLLPLAIALLAGCSDGTDVPPPPPSSLSIAPTAIPEGAPGEMNALRFRISMTEAQPAAVRVRYRTEGDSAQPDVDFLPAEGEVTLEPGALSAAITVDVFG
ncbi:MAG TPA: hypothetical protein DCP75_18705, partial [Haliea salexigens]|nr:hypothetical protein [Haliea salexigens]